MDNCLSVTCNGVDEPKRSGQVEESFCRISDRIERIEHIIDRLNEILLPVLCPQPPCGPSGCEKTPVPSPRAPLAEVMDVAAGKLSRAGDNLAAIMDRIEL